MMRVAQSSAIALLCVAMTGAALGYRAHLVRQGIAIEAARRDAIEAANAQRARDALRQANARVRTAQDTLDATLAALSASKQELLHERNASAVLQSELAIGPRRLSVLARARAPGSAGQDQGDAAASLDSGAALVADLDGRVASDLEWARQTRNEAIERLDACIAAYDAVRAAVQEQELER